MALVGGGPGVNPIHDFGWYKQHLYIQDRLTHAHVNLQPTRVQRALRRAILDNEEVAKPSRIIVLKARREGISTIVQATFAHRAFTRRNVWAYTIAHEIEAASNLFNMTETMYANLPAALRPAKVSGNLGRQLRLANGAYLRTETARDVRAGRSGAATMLHGSEVAFWDHGDEVLRSILSTIPDVPGTIVVLESTANGIQGAFYKRWQSAKRGESEYQPLFFSWLEDPVYALASVQSWEDLAALDDEEEELRVEQGASPAQIGWRRRMIRTEFDGDLDGFHQEYPSTDHEAFITSGRQFFGAGYISRFHPVEPMARAHINGAWKKGAEVSAQRNPQGPLWVYAPKLPDHRYVIFIDPAGTVGETRARHFSDPRDISDYTAMWVVDCTTMETVAVYHDRQDIGQLGEVAAKLGLIYNKAVICPEVTGGYGLVIVEKLRDLGYGGAIHRDRERTTYGRDTKSAYGWQTTIATRPIMLETLRDVLRETPQLLKHAPLKDEMHSFVIGKSRPEAGPGTHDDLIFAAAGAYTIADEYAQRRPIQLKSMTNGKKPRKRQRFNDTLMRARQH